MKTTNKEFEVEENKTGLTITEYLGNNKEMNLKQAASRLLWRFKSKKAFTPNENDINALNCFLEWINNQKK